MADRYWVGGAGTWNATNTANWSDQSGGAGGFSVPTAADDVYFNAASNATSYTVTTSGNTTDMVCRNLNVAGPLTGTLTFSTTTSSVNIFGSLNHAASGVTWGISVGLTFASTSTGNTITSNGYSFIQNLTFDGVGGEWSLQDDLTISSSRAFFLLNGSIKLNNYTFTCYSFQTNVTNTRSINFGTGKISVTGNNLRIIDIRNSTGLTVTGTPVIECTYSGATGTRTLDLGALSETNAISLNVIAGTDIVTNSSVSSYKNLNFTGFAGTWNSANTQTIYGNLTVSTGLTAGASTSALIFAGTSGTQTITTNGKTLDRPITFNGIGGTFQLQDNLTIGDTRTVTLTNGALDLNSKTLSCGLFSSSNSNTRSITFGTGNITLTGSGATIWSLGTMTGFSYTGTPTVNCTYAGSTGTRTISIGSATESRAVSFNISAGSDIVTFATTNGVYKNINFTGFSGSATLGSSIIVYGNLTIPAGITFSSTTATMSFRATSGTQTITTNGVTFDFPIVFNGIGGTFQFADALTQGSTRAFTITNGTVKLKSGATSTVGAFATSGSTQKYLQSTTAGSQATLSQASGTVNASYLTVKDINATGGATWNAYRNLSNIDAGNNTGWDFLSTPVTTTTLAMRLGFGL